MKFAIYLLALVVVLGGLFVYFRPDPSSSPSTSTVNVAPASTSGPPAAPSMPAATIATTKVGDTPEVSGMPQLGATTSSSAAAMQPTPQVFDLVIRRSRLVSGPTVIQVHKGDQVILRLTSDGSDELHLHGYDLHAPTRAGQTTTLQFSATKTGRFGYELHHAKTELGALEVYPR